MFQCSNNLLDLLLSGYYIGKYLDISVLHLVSYEI